MAFAKIIKPTLIISSSNNNKISKTVKLMEVVVITNLIYLLNTIGAMQAALVDNLIIQQIEVSQLAVVLRPSVVVKLNLSA
jgi:hypothetical protein